MKKYFLSICAIARFEENYVREWVIFHLAQGIDHIYLYDNDPEFRDQFKSISEFVEDGYVTVIPFIGKETAQYQAYQHYLANYGKDSEWTAFIDIDEFLHSRKGKKLYECIRELYFQGTGAIAVHWMLFGSSGFEDYSTTPVTVRFSRRAKNPDKHVKSIVNNAATRDVGKNPHYFQLHDGYFAVNEWGKILRSEYTFGSGVPTAELLQIAHYHTKSFSEYARRKLSKPDANSGKTYTLEQVKNNFTAHDTNEIEDNYVKGLWTKIQNQLQITN